MVKVLCEMVFTAAVVAGYWLFILSPVLDYIKQVFSCLPR